MYLECNGQSVKREEFPDLFEKIKTTYGCKDQESFYLPSLTMGKLGEHYAKQVICVKTGEIMNLVFNTFVTPVTLSAMTLAPPPNNPLQNPI